jgi:myo-inositol-1(or 4)-monophosphatase
MTVSDDASELLGLATAVAHEAGAELLSRAEDLHTVRMKSSDTDPVSEADQAAEALLVERIRAARPDDGILAEEGSDRRGTSGLRWVIDPLDGTVNYLYGFPVWAVSIAVEDSHGPLVGVVHDPRRDELFSATRGGGARRGETELSVNDPVALDRALVATGFSYDRGQRRHQAQLIARVLPAVRDVRRAGAAALDLCSLAAGRVDAYYEHGLAPWDWAAGSLIAGEAGATVAEVTDPVTGVSGVVAAGPGLSPELRALLEQAAG